ncbi:MAG: hypothetical protein HOQ21_09825 [Dermatophilaceae bacterium]|nr:hypothetical protein [Dermatophilaceae bacterium]
MPQEPFTFHQGVVVAWDVLAGTNTVRVLGVEVQNLPSLLGSEVGLIRPDDTVGLIKFHNTYFVVGRIEGAGVQQRAFGVQSQRVAAAVSTASSTFAALSGGPSVDVHIGSSRRCRVEIGGHISAFGGVAYMGFKVSGASSINPTNSKALGCGGSSATIQIEVTVDATRVINLSADDGLVEGLNTFTVMYQALLDPGGSTEFTDREISVQPF